MTKYLLDANVFIQSARTYYSFDIAPGFWKWIDLAHARGDLFTVEKVRDEVAAGNDATAAWMKQRPASFALPLVAADQPSLAQLSVWASAGHFTPSAVTEFLGVADYYLVAQAHRLGYTVVTLELADPNRKNRVKVPDVCSYLGVPCITTFEMIRQEKVQFN